MGIDSRPDTGIALPGRRRAPGHARLRRALPGALGVALLLAGWALRRVAASLRRALPQIAAGLAAAIPVLRSTIHAVAIGWQPAGDDGIIVTRAWDVLTSHSPLVGQYSEAGNLSGQIVHSPGPMLYWLLALPARLGSVASIAGWMGAFNTLAIVGTVALARRRGGLALMFATAAAIALMCQSLPSESFHDVWNPAAALFPFLLLIFLCWSLACGDHRLAPLTVAVASFVTQTHLTYLAPTLGMIAVILACALAARGDRRRRLAPPRSPAKPRAADAGAAPGGPPVAANGEGARAAALPLGLAAALAADWPETDDLMSADTSFQAAARRDARPADEAAAASASEAAAAARRDADPRAAPGESAPAPAASSSTEQAGPVAPSPPGARARGRSQRTRAPAGPRVPLPRWALIAVVVAAACWAPPLLDEIEHGQGNLTLIAQTTSDRGPTLGAGDGWNAVVRSVGVTPWWLYVPSSEWSRKYDVRVSSSAGSVASAVLIVGSLVLIALVASLRRRRDLAAAALIGLILCAALAANVSQTPVSPLLAATIGYTAWWGSMLGMWAWLVIAWALVLVLAPVGARSAPLRALAVRLDMDRPGRRPALAAIGSLAGVAGVAAIGAAVAATEHRDSHAHQYGPIAAIVTRLDAAVPAGTTVRFTLGAQNGSTQPMEPAIRYGLVRHGDLPLSTGALARLGRHYELLDKSYRWYVLIGDGTGPLAHMARVVTVSFTDGFGRSVFSAWVARVGAGGALERPLGLAPAASYAFGRRIT